ncbi:pyridoxal phosphate-dependent aminotransferase [Sinanaerobacter sp. ZZT-01]|uniref:pyridoxal phosphate-dependent aminotransferase n=1 Tax=Sinanaerobacter sp. ZZT-01 TaxID=3111540 RepID=UPI002D79545E|nr:pyridoxal phosphate-dependent aminotransferase [Sinanaerobacter sp. ZZT-01]WRR92408.1 pyridoxal phosphate-dependent aminotransferase [Sinanaerobacter sp. ZZT-01]
MKNLSIITENYPASGIRKMFELAKNYQNVISLTVGEPSFDTPLNIKEIAKKAMDENYTHYVSNAGLPELRRVIADKYNKRIQSGYTENNVMVAFGGMEAIFLALLATVNPGDEVLIPDPGYPNYEGQITILGAKPVRVPIFEKNNFNIKAEDIEKAITEKTKVLIINSPSNPLGSVLGKKELAEIAAVVEKHDLFVISDEVYEEIIYGDFQHHSLAEFSKISENVLIVNSLSKTYAMTGWRVGYVVGNEKIIEVMPQLQEGIASCVPPFVQLAAIEAIEHGAEAIQYMRSEYERKRSIVIEAIEEIDGMIYQGSAGSFYAFINITAFGKSSQEFAEDLIRNAKVIVVPGSAFGPMGEGYIRVVFAASDDILMEAFDRIKTYVNSLKESV